MRFDTDNYDHQELVILEIPHSIPYLSDQPDFLRVDGEFKHEGEYYKMVKQRISVDTIYMIAIKDKMRKKTEEVLCRYSKSLKAEKSAEKSESNISINFRKDYFGSYFAMAKSSFGYELIIIKRSAPNKHFSLDVYTSVFNPPERV